MDQISESSPVSQMPSMPQGPSFLQKYKFTLLALAVVLIAAVPLLLLSNTASKPKVVQPLITQNASQGSVVSPTTAPLTTDNADSTFSQSDTQIQSTLNQMDTDLQQESQVDSSQDSTSGL